MIKPQSEILYFPSIEFYDVGWLKGALCHWDKIYRIVPPSYTPKDCDEVKEAIDAGLVESINLTSGDLSDTAIKFSEFWDSAPLVPAGFEKIDEELVRLHPEKVDARIRDQLFALARKVDHEGFGYLPQHIANSYMLFLSESISRRRLLPKITDDVDMFTAMTFYQNDGNFDDAIYKEDCDEITATLALSSLVPNGIEDYSMSKVIKFHQANNEGREAFRVSVANLIDEIKGIKNAEFFGKRLLKFEEGLVSSRKSILSILKTGEVDIGYSLLSVGLPMAFASLGVIGLTTNPWTIQSIGGSVFLGAVAALADHARSRRLSWTSKEASYWLSLQSAFKSGGDVRLQLPHFHRHFEEFIND